MRIRWSEIYANTDILSPIDQQTWRVIAETSKIGPSSRVLEIASGKGAFAKYLAENFHCRVEGFDHNSEFVAYSNDKVNRLGLRSNVKFTQRDVNNVEVDPNAYDLGVCLGALYIFRENGWNVLTRAVKPGAYLAISDMVCKKFPPPRELVKVFFEESAKPWSIEDARQWYASREARIVREDTCSLRSWFEYYDLTGEMLSQISKTHLSEREIQVEVEEGRREARLFRKYGSEYIDYITFIMRMG